MNNIKIGVKLIASFVLVAILAAFMGTYMMNGLGTLNDQAAKESAQGATQVNQSANELSKVASNLKNVAGQFKV